MKKSGGEKCNDVASHLLADLRCGFGKIPYSATLDDCRLIILAGRYIVTSHPPALLLS
jgi:hypothetical protein